MHLSPDEIARDERQYAVASRLGNAALAVMFVLLCMLIAWGDG